jgi:site-specific DNA recombinase
MTRIVAAHCRTACAKQSDPLSGVRLQEKEIRRYAKRHGLAIEASYADAGVSGIKLQRPELQRLLADCRAGLIDTVITRDPERLSRDSGQLLLHLQTFRKAGVRVEYSEEAHNNGSVGTLLSAVADFEAKRRLKPKPR